MRQQNVFNPENFVRREQNPEKDIQGLVEYGRMEGSKNFPGRMCILRMGHVNPREGPNLYLCF